MKTIILEMVTARILFSMVTMATATDKKTGLRDRQYLSFEEAMKHGDLVLALYQQTQATPSSSRTPFYLSAAILGDIQYIVMGSSKEWKWFYSVKWEYLLRTCPCAISTN